MAIVIGRDGPCAGISNEMRFNSVVAVVAVLARLLQLLVVDSLSASRCRR
jgi:hypothetical protein